MKNKSVALGALALTLCFVTTSCSLINNQTAEPTPEDTITTETLTEVVEKPIVPTFGDTLKLSARNPLTLNPLLNEDRSIDQILKLVFEPLYQLDTHYKPVANLVDQSVYDAENYTITLTLKTGLIFQNQEPLTADDVEYSINVLKEAPATVVYKSCVENIQRTSVVDDLTLKIYLKQPYAFSAYYLCFPIVPKDYNESEGYDPFKPIGSGLYAFVDFTAMKEINLTASQARKSEVYVQNIACALTRDEAVDTDTFKQNLIDLIAPAKFNWLEHSDDTSQRTLTYTTNYLEFIGFNFTNTLLSNVKMRQAIAYGIQRENIAQKQYLSHVVLTDTLIHPSSWLQPESNALVYNYNVDTSKGLLEEIPLTDNDADGFYDVTKNAVATKITFKLLVNKDNVSRMSVAGMIKNDLAAIGIDITIDAVDKATFLTKLNEGQFDLVLSGWKLSSVPDFTDFFHSKKIVDGSNFISYNNPLMDKALENVFASTNDEALIANLQKMNTLYETDLPYFSLYFMNAMIITNDQIYGELAPITDNVLNGIQNVYISR